MDFEKEIDKLAKQVEQEGFRVNLGAQEVAVQLLEDVDARHGDLPYHNASHGLDVVRRGLRLTSALLPYIDEKYQKGIYNLPFLAGPAHDFVQGANDHQNVRDSADHVIQRIHENGHNEQINCRKVFSRIRLGIYATEVRREKSSGKVTQVNLQEGSRDPIKFIMAMADINGIAMEGPKRMVRDAVNLCYEMNDGKPTADQLYGFVLFQQKFLKDRLQDDQTKEDIKYYFGDHSDEVYDLGYEKFNGMITTAYSIARSISGTPIISNIINDKLKAASHIPGSKIVQDNLVKALNL